MFISKSGRHNLPSLVALTVATLLAAGCGSSTTSINSNSQTVTGSAFVVGTDAPMASVVSFSVQVGIAATDENGNTVQLVSGSPTVDFARFNGLQTLIDMNDVPVGTYAKVAITLSNGTIGYLDTSTAEPTIKTMPANLTNATVSYTLANPMVVAQAGAPVGLHMDFNLRKSIVVSNGQITGDVIPTFAVNGVNNNDKGAYIDEFDAAVVSTDAGKQTLTVQGPHGRQFTVNVTGQTEWDGGAMFSDLTSSSIVQISGSLDRADATIDADEIAILSDSGFYAAGQVTYVNPSSGPATSFDLYVRGLLPTTTGLTLGQIATIDLSGSEKYSIYWMHGPFAQFLFNQSGLLPGQHIAVGGPASGATDPTKVTVKRVVLRHWGFNGTVVPGSVNTGNNTFQMTVNGFAGLLIPQTVTVYIPDNCEYRDGLTQLSDVSSATNVRVVGLLLKNPTNGNTVLVGHYVDDLN
ncbi:DUF4382 domain-containing protein [Telmatobacter sp. DSM 110680]|uniref:DUF4382 domain-containing protein n=1 Tax=Telmatobacter sp. DSM 110680 TaxID=3036704 RepID=A0AAU7DIZ3_9BACT